MTVIDDCTVEFHMDARRQLTSSRPAICSFIFTPQPFSNGLVTVMVPQLRRENSLLLWNVYDLHSPVHIFVGHDDVVLEFQWRKQKEGWFPSII